MYTGVLPYVCHCTVCSPGAHRSQKRVSDFLVLELQVDMKDLKNSTCF